MTADLRRKLLYSLIFALLVYIALALYSDWRELAQALRDFPWRWVPVVVVLTLVNYLGRLYKWQWYLGLLNVPIARGDSARIFGVGMLMVLTPGKAGEFLKSYMVKNVTGTPMSITAPIVLAERMTDGMAMLILASIGLFAFPDTMARLVAALVFACSALLITVIQIRPLALWFLSFGQHLPVVKRFAGSLFQLYESCYLIFKPRNLFISLLIGVLSWGAEGVAYYLVLRGFGVQPTVEHLLIGVFIFCISAVIGAVFAMPGGLGGVEGSLVALSVRILGLTTATATAGALLIRFCTLWLGVGIGVISFLLWPALLAGAENARREPVAAGD
jgi:uncharacterized protein (TIRG00374 family)